MNLKPLLTAALLTAATGALAQGNNTNDYPTQPGDNKTKQGTTPVTPDDYPAYVKAKKDLKKFDYFYLRLTFPLTSGSFNNPLAGSFDNSNVFTDKDKPNNKFRVGLNLGTVSHFLDVGTYKLRLGVNVGVDLQAYGRGDDTTVTHHIYTGHTFLASLAVGPQLTYKPSPMMRVALYARIGATGVYDNYQNYQTVTSSDAVNSYSTSYEANVQLSNIGLSEDIGADFTWRKLSIGIDYAFFKTHAGSGKVYDPDDVNANKFYSTKTTTPNTGTGSTTDPTSYTAIAPTVNFGRLDIHVGFAF